MKRYLRLYFIFFKNCLMRDLEFRFNVIIWSLVNFLWFGFMFVNIKLVFGQVEAIGGWDENKVLLLMLVFALFQDFTWTFVMDNMDNFVRMIRKGEMDFVLLKPTKPRFLVSTRYFEFDHYPRIFLLIFLLPVFLRNLGIEPGIFDWLNFIFLFTLGIFIFYNLFFLLATTNFWFINLFNLQDLFMEMISMGRSPVTIFQGGLRFIFSYVVPIAYVGTFPVKALLEGPDLKIIFWGLLIAIILFALSQWFWNFALKRYSSAGG